MGLLDAVESLSEINKSGNKSPEKILEQLKRWRQTLLNKEIGFDIFNQIFKDLVSILNIEKGLLLTYNRMDNSYIPWAAKGYDKTTLGRFRFSVNEIQDLTGKEKSAVILPQKKITPFKPYLSMKDLSLMEQLMIIPFFHNGNFHAYLFISESPMLKFDGTKIFELLKIISEAGRFIYINRESRFEHLNLPPRFLVPDQKEEILNYIESHAVEVLYLCRLPLGSFLNEMKKIFPYTQEDAVKSDCLFFFSTFLNDTGAVFDIPGQEILMIIKQNRFPDRELLFHQISLAMKNIYTELVQTPGMIPDIQIINGPDRKKNGAILESLLNDSL